MNKMGDEGWCCSNAATITAAVKLWTKAETTGRVMRLGRACAGPEAEPRRRRRYRRQRQRQWQGWQRRRWRKAYKRDLESKVAAERDLQRRDEFLRGKGGQVVLQESLERVHKVVRRAAPGLAPCTCSLHRRTARRSRPRGITLVQRVEECFALEPLQSRVSLWPATAACYCCCCCCSTTSTSFLGPGSDGRRTALVFIVSVTIQHGQLAVGPGLHGRQRGCPGRGTGRGMHEHRTKSRATARRGAAM